MKEQAALDIAWVCRKEIGKKVASVISLALFLFALTLVLGCAVGFLRDGIDITDRTLFDATVSGVGLLCGFSAESVDESSAPFVYAMRLLWVFISFFLSAFVAVQIARPINPIAISPLFVLDTDDIADGFEEKSEDPAACPGFLEFRYWIRLTDGDHLYQVDCQLELTDVAADNRGINKTRPLFSYRQEYHYARGVRVLRVPLHEKSLLDALQPYFNLAHDEENEEKSATQPSGSAASSQERAFMRLRIMGVLKNGQRAVAHHVFRVEDFRNGYRFAPIRKTNCTLQPIEEIGGTEHMLSAHFGKLYRCDHGGLEERGLPLVANEGKEVLESGAIKPSIYDRVSHGFHLADYRLRTHAKCSLQKIRETRIAR